MTTFATTDELDVLKAQMNVLRTHLQNNEIISKEMLEATLKAEVKHLVGKRSFYLRTMVIDLLMIGWWTWFYMHTEMGMPFYVASVVWFLLWAGVAFKDYRQNMRDQLLNASLTDAALHLVNLKKQNLNMAKLKVVATIIWLGFLFNELWGVLSDTYICLSVSLMIFIVTYFTSAKMQQIHRTTTDLLRQIDELKK